MKRQKNVPFNHWNLLMQLSLLKGARSKCQKYPKLRGRVCSLRSGKEPCLKEDSRNISKESNVDGQTRLFCLMVQAKCEIEEGTGKEAREKKNTTKWGRDQIETDDLSTYI
ncbi:hypothetical protein EPI10_016399 [Gossypium australe]|uniref:Uncharacterized protein n=1 Tax=Gossypium australe TaxID=47621 RepID=A0A5B6VNS1_9ROSI|nr:hypothetical protein EPI10_016399 [Gossypium australe]